VLPLVLSPQRHAFRQVSSVLPFVPLSVESFGRLGVPALTLLGDLADQAVACFAPHVWVFGFGACICMHKEPRALLLLRALVSLSGGCCMQT
jgi:hypothetical protein